MELHAVGFVYATRVYPKVLETISGGLFTAQFDFAIAWLHVEVLTDDVAIGDFFPVFAPGMGENGVRWFATASILDELYSAVLLNLNESHSWVEADLDRDSEDIEERWLIDLHEADDCHRRGVSQSADL